MFRANPYGAAAAAGAAALGGLRYPFAAGLRPQLPHMGANSPFNPQHVASTAAKAAEEKRYDIANNTIKHLSMQKPSRCSPCSIQ